MKRIYTVLLFVLIAAQAVEGVCQEINYKDSTKKIQIEIKKIKSSLTQEVGRHRNSEILFNAWKQNQLSTNKWKTEALDADFLDSLNINVKAQLTQKRDTVASVQRIVDSVTMVNHQIQEVNKELISNSDSVSSKKDSLQRINTDIKNLKQRIEEYRSAINQPSTTGSAGGLSIEDILTQVKNANPYLKSVEQIFRTQYKEELAKIDQLIKTDATKVRSADAEAAGKLLSRILGDYGFVPDDGILLEYSLKLNNVTKYTHFMDTARLYFSRLYDGSLRKRLIEIRANILDANTGGWLSVAATDTLNLYLTAVNGYCKLTNELKNDFIQKVPELFRSKRFTKENVNKLDIISYLWVSPYLRGVVDDFIIRYELSPSQHTLDQAAQKLYLKEDCFSYLQK